MDAIAGRFWWHWSVWKCISPSGKAPIGLPSSRMFEISITAWMIAHELLGVDHRRGAEFFREANLVPLAQLLTAQEDDEAPVPGVSDVREGVIVYLFAQIDTDDLGAQRRR